MAEKERGSCSGCIGNCQSAHQPPPLPFPSWDSTCEPYSWPSGMVRISALLKDLRSALVSTGEPCACMQYKGHLDRCKKLLCKLPGGPHEGKQSNSEGRAVKRFAQAHGAFASYLKCILTPASFFTASGLHHMQCRGKCYVQMQAKLPSLPPEMRGRGITSRVATAMRARKATFSVSFSNCEVVRSSENGLSMVATFSMPSCSCRCSLSRFCRYGSYFTYCHCHLLTANPLRVIKSNVRQRLCFHSAWRSIGHHGSSEILLHIT